MSDRAALLAEICANPDDDTARLVFADWLDENGEGKRAAYIRAAVQLNRLEEADTPAATMQSFLTDMRLLNRENKLYDRVVDWSQIDPDLAAIHAAEKAQKAVRLPRQAVSENLPKIAGVKFDVEDVGGFYNEVVVRDPAAFVANAEAIFRAAPIYYLNFTDQTVTASQMREFAATGYLARVRWLTFANIEPEAIRVLGNHPDTAGVTMLEMYCTDRPSELIEQFVAGPHWTGLNQLIVSGSDVINGGDPDRDAAQILRCPQLSRLQQLALFNNELGDDAARVIATCGLTELRTLDLSLNYIGAEGAAALAESKLLPKLRYLDFSNNAECPTAGTFRLIVSPKLQSLTALRLYGCDYETNGVDVAALAAPSRGPTLRALELECGSLKSRAMAAFGKCPAVQGLWFLSLLGGGVNDAGIRALTQSEGFKQLTILDVSVNKITARGAEALAAWPVPLQALNLSGNTINVKGAKALIASEHRQGLKRLLVTGRGEAHLRKHFGKRVVR